MSPSIDRCIAFSFLSEISHLPSRSSSFYANRPLDYKPAWLVRTEIARFGRLIPWISPRRLSENGFGDILAQPQSSPRLDFHPFVTA
jgi:hypothetical protein